MSGFFDIIFGQSEDTKPKKAKKVKKVDKAKKTKKVDTVKRAENPFSKKMRVMQTKIDELESKLASDDEESTETE